MMSPLRDAVAAADGFAVGHLGHFEARVGSGRREKQMPAVRREIGSVRAASPCSGVRLEVSPTRITPRRRLSFTSSFL